MHVVTMCCLLYCHGLLYISYGTSALYTLVQSLMLLTLVRAEVQGSVNDRDIYTLIPYSQKIWRFGGML